MTALLEAPTPITPNRITFLELEITRECQLTCPSHCYAQAGPGAGHGSMTGDDWRRVISDAAGIGVTKVQFIGGEPTRHPEFADLVRHALAEGLNVQVFSNLYRVRAPWWELFAHPRLSLGTSYYSVDPDEHDAVTGRKGSHARTRASIAEAVRRGVPIKVGIIHLRDGRRTEQARAEMEALGVTRVHVDRVRGVGNAARVLPSVTELCGACGDSRAAIGPNGEVWPCVLSRFLHPAGNVRRDSLAQILGGEVWAALASAIPRRRGRAGCTPDEDSCMPSPGDVPPNDRTVTACNPDQDSSDCSPAETPACLPKH
ncbi:radical SAM/SPASM domain-containing protein [Streptomyces sp. ME18-1-4]|uniref:radical SAM/SPASM domain-containing protein n=1 Tax=Streptomyces sp. ME18-1-4 TaxID=3028685 RepID=UPI0029BD9F99|nr:radical SAM/SPASM domain-containing protein [Streptomyces sp. ME18-1-4]MDX3248616.1 radical SAM/SPASM domain-containing protein [Streptomyces sp. ME18-1-4]